MTRHRRSDQSARAMFIENMPLFAVINAEYKPPCAAPPWAASLIGVRTRWLANCIIQNGPFAGQWAMTPYPLPLTVDCPTRWVPLEHLRAIETTGSASDGAARDPKHTRVTFRGAMRSTAASWT